MIAAKRNNTQKGIQGSYTKNKFIVPTKNGSSCFTNVVSFKKVFNTLHGLHNDHFFRFLQNGIHRWTTENTAYVPIAPDFDIALITPTRAPTVLHLPIIDAIFSPVPDG